MSQIQANELKKQLYILIDRVPHIVLSVQFASPSARGASTMVKAKVRNLLNGYVQDKTFRTSEKFDEPDIEKVPVVYTYEAEGFYHFMDNTTYEDFSMNAETLGDIKFYLKPDSELKAMKFDGKVISLELPAVVELKVAETEPPIKGSSAAGKSSKKATLETGLEVMVPLYTEPGTLMRVNTETGEVSGRAQS